MDKVVKVDMEEKEEQEKESVAIERPIVLILRRKERSVTTNFTNLENNSMQNGNKLTIKQYPSNVTQQTQKIYGKNTSHKSQA